MAQVHQLQSLAVQHETSFAVVRARGVGVRYITSTKREDLKSRAHSLFQRTKRQEFWALREVSFVAQAGEILGVIGANGAGKTTLCRVLANLLRPDEGTIAVQGSVSALLSLGTGFNSELSGRENVFLNAMMLGLSRRQIHEMLPDIVAFSGLERFIDEPLKHYSSGMKARLGFSIAAMIEPEILILDETLSVGDLGFQAQAGEKMQQLVRKAKLVMVVSHQLSFVQKYCTRALWLEGGTVRADGLPQEVVPLYQASMSGAAKAKSTINFCETRTEPRSSLSAIVARDLGVQFVLKEGTKRPFWALKDVTFSTNEGEIVGIIGPNGAGKTTLCQVLSGILRADSGQVSVRGEITALLTLGAGFNIQLSGRDNIYLNGMMLGITKKKLRALYADIVAFAELGKFIDEPVKHYSSGMRSRLAFSIAAAVKPDIFIVDEVLSVGDAAFYERASVKIQELITQAKVVLVVTHNLNFVEKVCTRAIWLDKGMIQFDGDPREAIVRYRRCV